MRKLAVLVALGMLFGSMAVASASQERDAVVWTRDAASVEASGAEVLATYDSFLLVHGSEDSLKALRQRYEVETVSTLLSKARVQFDTRLGDAPLPGKLRALPGDDHFVVQFRGPIKPEWRDALAAQGAVLDYLPHNAFVVRAASQDALRALPLVGFVGPYHAAYKLHADFPDSGAVTADLRIFHGESPDPALAKVRELGGDVVEVSDGPLEQYVRITLDASKASELAQQPAIAWIEEVRAGDPYDNDRAAWVTQSGRSPTNPDTPRGNSVHQKGLSGRGQVVTVADGGIDSSGGFFIHEMYADGACGPYNFGAINPCHRKVLAYYRLTEGGVPRGDFTGNTHGTHTAGSVTGDAPDGSAYGTWNKFDGQAPGSKIAYMDWSSLPLDYFNMFDPTYQAGARVHSNSYGYPHDISYNLRARQNDLYSASHPDFLIFRSAGNTGTNTIRPEAVAKDVVTSGATENGEAYNDVAGFTSRGPAGDGRIKPTFTAPGNPVMSSILGGGYGQLSGTSMSTPTSTGGAALIRQYFQEGWYPAGTAGSGTPFNPSSALVRAVLINSARPMLGTSITGPNLATGPEVCPLPICNAMFRTNWPNGDQGWGIMRLDTALHFPGDPENTWVRDGETLTTGASKTYTLNVLNPTQGLKLVLAWTDPAAIEGANPALINDLDLTLTSPSGLSYKGNVFMGNGTASPVPPFFPKFDQPPQSAPFVGRADRKNVEEVFVLPNPELGPWTVTVTGAAVPSGPQAFALAAAGGI